MTKLNLDLRFVEFNSELYALDNYISFVEDKIKSLLKQRESEIKAEIKKNNLTPDDALYALYKLEINSLNNRFLPKYFRNPIIVTLWAIVETCLKSIAEYIGEQENKKLRFKDIRAENFLLCIKKYFEYVLNFPILSDQKIYNKFYEVMKLRHLIVHNNGKISNPKDAGNIKFIKDLMNKYKTISLDFDEIIISKKYINVSFSIIRIELENIINETKRIY